MKINKTILLITMVIAACFMTSCAVEKISNKKIKDLDYTVVSEIEMPVEVMEIVKNRKQSPFKVTYSDNKYTYIIIGYGRQKYPGYSIKIEELYETKNAICVKTRFDGPTEYSSIESETYPYVVLKIEYNDKTVVFGA